jgi:hypothetical protein
MPRVSVNKLSAIATVTKNSWITSARLGSQQVTHWIFTIIAEHKTTDTGPCTELAALLARARGVGGRRRDCCHNRFLLEIPEMLLSFYSKIPDPAKTPGDMPRSGRCHTRKPKGLKFIVKPADKGKWRNATGHHPRCRIVTWAWPLPTTGKLYPRSASERWSLLFQ